MGEVPAGTRIENLSFTCFDETGAPAAGGVAGRVMTGWMARARKASLPEEGALVMLPKFNLPTTVSALPFRTMIT